MAGYPQGAATTAKAKAATKAPSVDLQHVWEGPVPKDIPELKGASLVVRYEVRPDDGTVWATLHQVLGPDGKVMPDFWRLPGLSAEAKRWVTAGSWS